jgi:hypothetical protein
MKIKLSLYKIGLVIYGHLVTRHVMNTMCLVQTEAQIFTHCFSGLTKKA